ncbi:ABC transporter permease [Pedobacter nutrimenti]|uniref:ABC-type lipoprotein release transport system permease subunit n=1 Tax=Pedobacter nutrimenti TaxID=1241337 RepID=A0A318UAN0_9SPHI|nr:ABC transporter permease [Pedobacter nutrimenti]PYF68837.1 ABC-type lipoprotein release transport system permease subunit [Pedobacter nutrimenti]
MFRLSLKIAFRNLLKHKGFSLINIGGLAIGMACCLMFLLYVRYEWSYNKQFKNIDRIYAVYKNYHASAEIFTYGGTGDALPRTLAPAALQTIPEVEQASRIARRYSLLFNYKENTFKKDGYFVDPSFLNILDYPFTKGNAQSSLKDPGSVVLTESTAKGLFGNEDPMGKVVKWDNHINLKVTGIIADPPLNQTYRFDMLMPWSLFEREAPDVLKTDWGSGFCNTIVLLKEHSNFNSADAQFRKIFKLNEQQTHSEAFLFPWSKAHLYNKFENGKQAGGKIEQVRMFVLLAFCILLIACINYMNLSTARSEKRAREVGVRKTLGSSRASLAAQFFTESILLSLVAVVIAFMLTEASLPYFNRLLDIQMTIDYYSYTFWGALLLLMLVTGLAAGSYPSFYLSSFIPVKVLKGFSASGRSSLPIRKILVVLQFGFSICMIIAALVIYGQINFIRNKPLGFEQNNLVQLDRSGEFKKAEKRELFKAELIKSGAVVSATEFSNGFTNGGDNTTSFEWPGKLPNENIVMNYRATGYDFTKTTGVTLLQGRDFSRDYGTDSLSVILNESTVQAMRLKNPIGTRIKWEGSTFTVIGVMKNYAYESAVYKVNPTLFFLNPKETSVLLLKLNPAKSLNSSLQAIQDMNARINPAYPSNLQFISQNMEDKFRNERTLGALSNVFGGFAIFISCLGLLGLALYMAEQRSKEISIRKVLGADLGNILVLLNKDFVKLVLISNVIACPVAYIFAKQWLQKYDYKIDITIWPFLLALLLSLLIALLTISMQSFKVARANAVDALKYE